jgi:hypothetical protein
MRNPRWLVLLVVLALMAGTVGALTWLKGRQKLGPPGVVATPIPGKVEMKLELPERVLDYTSTNVPEPEIVSQYLPRDTSFVERCYTLSDGSPPISATIVLMGLDRTSIHRAEYCLVGQGLGPEEKTVADIAIAGAEPYRLSAAKWKVGGVYQDPDGRKVKVSGVYVFWFVTEQEQTADYDRFQYGLVRHLLLTGELQRWAYVSYFTLCAPGQEDAAFARMEKLIAASVPAYQLPPGKR